MRVLQRNCATVGCTQSQGHVEGAEMDVFVITTVLWTVTVGTKCSRDQLFCVLSTVCDDDKINLQAIEFGIMESPSRFEH